MTCFFSNNTISSGAALAIQNESSRLARYIDINVPCTQAAGQDTLISILFVYGHRCEPYLGDHPSSPRFLSVSSRTASGKSAGPALRRCPAPTRSDERTILALDVAKPSQSTRYGGGGLATCDGSDYLDGRSQALTPPRSAQDHGRPCGWPRPSDDPDAKGAKVAGTRRSVWRETHAAVEALLRDGDSNRLRNNLRALA
jgi:hypothetical protein